MSALPPISFTQYGPNQYILDHDYPYYSPRYNKTKTLPAGMVSDGATGATDIVSAAWWVHDALLEDGDWDDMSPVSRLQAARVLSDILMSEGRWIRAWTGRRATGPFWALVNGNHLP